MLENKVVLIGYSGHGYVVADVAIDNNLNLVGYAEKSVLQQNPFNLNYLGSENEIYFFNKNKDSKFLIGIGDNNIRESIFKVLLENDFDIMTLISQHASISNYARIGKGTFINRNVSINALANVGNNVILNTACIIEHGCQISDNVHIAPGAVLAGNVSIGERSFVGANCVIKQGISVGKDVIIGAGTVVLSDIPDGKKLVGNPNRFI